MKLLYEVAVTLAATPQARVAAGRFPLIADYELNLSGFEYYVHSGTGAEDLEFLREAGSASTVGLNVGDKIASVEGVRHLRSDLRELMLSARWTRRPSLEPLKRFSELRVLALGGDGQFKDLQPLADLHSLRVLRLGSRKDVDLSLLASLPRLWHVELALGSLGSSFEVLAAAPRLRWLELYRIRSLTDLDGVGRMSALERLELGQLSNLQSLPDLRGASALRDVYIERCRNLRDLASLASAPSLERVLMVDMPHLQPEHLLPLVGHPTLRYFAAGTGSLRRNKALADVLGLPEPPGPDLPTE